MRGRLVLVPCGQLILGGLALIDGLPSLPPVPAQAQGNLLFRVLFIHLPSPLLSLHKLLQIARIRTRRQRWHALQQRLKVILRVWLSARQQIQLVRILVLVRLLLAVLVCIHVDVVSRKVSDVVVLARSAEHAPVFDDRAAVEVDDVVLVQTLVVSLRELCPYVEDAQRRCLACRVYVSGWC